MTHGAQHIAQGSRRKAEVGRQKAEDESQLAVVFFYQLVACSLQLTIYSGFIIL